MLAERKRLPLEGMKVLDLTRVLAGPTCTMLLSDMGAEVIKLERPGTGDDTRDFYPVKEGQSGYFLVVNRGKKSITLDLKHEEGKKIFFELLSHVDILVENFAPGVMARLGLDYETLSKDRPDLIYASISGFGQSGPMSPLPAYDPIIQAMSGMMEITGFPDGPPVKFGTSIVDITAGMNACIGILAAALCRKETGKGQHIDVAMLDVALAELESAIPRYFMLGESVTRTGNRYASGGANGGYATKDGFVFICGDWRRITRAMGRPELATDPKFSTPEAQRANKDELFEIVSTWVGQQTSEELMAVLHEARVPVGPVLKLEEILADPHVVERGVLVEVNHPVLGPIKVPNIPIKFSQTPSGPRGASPLLGEHNEEVLGQMLGLSPEKLQALKEEGVI